MDKVELDTLADLLAKATPGVWGAKPHHESRKLDAVYCDGVGKIAYCQPLFGRPHAPASDCEANAAAIVASVNFLRTNLPAIIEQRAEIERLREALSLYEDDAECGWCERIVVSGAAASAALNPTGQPA